MNNKVHIITNDSNWLDREAVNQLNKLSNLEGMRRVIGLPDLHPGKTPVGAVFITEDMIYPSIVGSDIGCGMSLFQTSEEKRKLRLDKWVRKLEALDSLKEIDISGLISKRACYFPHLESLGTIGGGNHFCELQEVDSVLDQEKFSEAGLDKGRLMLLVHTGSRIFGQKIYDEFMMDHNAKSGLSKKSESAALYLKMHDTAISWASMNRELVAYRMMSAMGIDTIAELIVDSCHNSVEAKKTGGKIFFVHRKGAAPADKGVAIIPGSRGTLTYLVQPCGDTQSAGWSLAHGAGRKWERSACKPRLKMKYTSESIKTTSLKSKVVCRSSELLYEEAPEAYKNIDHVVDAMVSAGLIHIIATLKPVLTYKG